MFDFIGVLSLVVLLLLFVWFMRRAWRSRRPLLKWPGVVLGGLLTLVSAALIVLALLGFYKLNEPRSNPVADIRVAGSPAQAARGKQLAHICQDCHASNGELPLSGLNFIAKYGLPPVGTIYAPNLTPSGNIKDWTDGEVIRAMREGVHKNGRSLLFMPTAMFRNMSDEDAQAVVAFLRSQPPTGTPTPENQFNLLGALFMNVRDFRSSHSPAGHVSAPPAGTAEYGHYMVNIIGCQNCHGDDLAGRVYSGVGPPAGPNLTKLVPQWTEEQFLHFFNTGIIPGGGQVPLVTFADGSKLPAMPWPLVRASATDDELKAMFSFLHSLQPIDGPTK